MKERGEPLFDFANTALLTNSMIEEKRICDKHHRYWTRAMSESISIIEHGPLYSKLDR